MAKGKHSFCPITRYCTRCGMPAEWFARHDIVVPCYPAGQAIVSLEWWKHLQAHNALHRQLVVSVARELGTSPD